MASSRRPKKNPRRVAFACFYGLVTFILLGSVVGFVQAASSPLEGIPKAFGVPAAEPGERPSYVQFNATDTVAPPAPRGVTIGLELSAPRWLKNHEGRDELVQSVSQLKRFDATGDLSGMIYHYRTSDGSIMAQDVVGTVSLNTTSVASGDVLDIRSESEYHYMGTSRSYIAMAENQMPCLFANRLQGTQQDLAREVDLLAPCALWDFSVAAFAPFEAISAQLSEDGMVVVFRETNTRQTLVWMGENCPYPLQVLLRHQNGTIDLLSLQSCDVRSDPIAHSEVRSITLAPPVSMVSRDRLGPSEELAMSFPLSDAWRLALEDSEAGVSAFLDANPDAYVASASYGAMSHYAHQEQWSFVITDGDDSLSVHVAKQERTETSLARYLTGEENVPVQYENVVRASAADGPYPAPRDAPQNLPDPRSVFARWEHYAGEAGGDPFWDFSIRCAQSEIGCADVVVQMSAGRIGSRWTQSGLFVNSEATFTYGSSLLMWQVEGTQARQILSQLSMMGTGQTRSSLIPPDSDGVEGTTVQPAATRMWVTPEPEWAIGAGAAAVVVAAVYWLGPQLKILGVAMFSRIEKPRTLDHPVRAEIMALIEQNPGIHLQGIIRRSGRGNGTVNHHVRTLINGGLVVASGTGFRCLFAKGALGASIARMVPLLKGETARTLVARILENPRSQKELATDLGITPASCHYFVHRLEEAGLLELRVDGRARIVHATPFAEPALAVAGA